jgi:hypothetical protein
MLWAHYVALFSRKLAQNVQRQSERSIWRDDLQLSVEAQFYRRHGFGKPAIEIEVVGIPSAFVKQDKETKLEYEARLRQMTQELEDDNRRQEVRKAHEDAMKIIMADYEQHLAGLFEAERFAEKILTPQEG